VPLIALSKLVSSLVVGTFFLAAGQGRGWVKNTDGAHTTESSR
jgi:hypothetical protein